MNIDFNKIGNFKDNIINSNYELSTCDASQLSGYLKKLYSNLNIDIDNHNGSLTEKTWLNNENVVALNPPKEIYEYQNFFLLQNKNGEYILLDGFRRLLWYTAPSTEILVRIYKEDDLSDKDILLLLVYLNHFKFYGGGQYLERGFSLLLKSVFNIDIFKYKSTFDSYLSRNITISNYSGMDKPDSSKYNENVKSRILNQFFVSDIRFIQDIFNSGYMCNSYLGSLTYKFRKDFHKHFDSNIFITYLNNSTVLAELMIKYNKVGTNRSAESQKVVNQILEIYEQAFNNIVGNDIVKSYAEKLKECRDLVSKFKKDKSLIKLTGNSNAWKIKRELRKRIIENGETVKFVCIVFPKEIDTYQFHKGVKYLEHGVIDVDIIYLRSTTHLMSKTDFFGFRVDDCTYTIRDNYSGYHNTGKSFTHIETNGFSQDIQLFAELPKEILK